MKSRPRNLRVSSTRLVPGAARRLIVMLTSAGLLLDAVRSPAADSLAVNLLERYPTTLEEGDASPMRARPWEFSSDDLYQVGKFALDAGNSLRLESGPADVGIGHCRDGAVWAIVIPRDDGTLTSAAARTPEPIAHVWLRFHPAAINDVLGAAITRAGTNADPSMELRMRAIARAKMTSSWHAGGKALIPGPTDLVVDADTRDGRRRFFVVDTEAGSSRYIAAFENRAVPEPRAVTPALARSAFDTTWEAFDREYPMFGMRPEVDWAALREEYRPRAIESRSVYELADVLAQMLGCLRDLHVGLTLNGAQVPVFARSAVVNANPAAHEAILGGLKQEGRLRWAMTAEGVGFLAIDAWDDPAIPDRCDALLETFRRARGLVVDVRLNAGGNEDIAGRVAGRFLEKQVVYAWSQFRDGPAHSDLTPKIERKLAPRGPWRYARPVILLIGQRCMSSNESFIAMMCGCPNLTTMGERTRGSSGNPRVVQLPLGLTVSVPRWIDCLPDGTPIDERGIRPHIPFRATTNSFTNGRDDLLSAAVERLSREPLPPR